MSGKAGRFESSMRESVGAGVTPRVFDAARVEPAGPDRHAGLARSRTAFEIPVEKLARDESQPREEFDGESLERLAASLKAKGQIQPIRVRWDEGRGVYVVVCGERRWRAAKLAGLATLTCVVHGEGEDVLAIQLVENALREDLKPVEQAKAFRRLIDRNNWGPGRLAEELSIDPAKVTRTLALLTLPEEVQDMVEQGALSATTAYEVSRLPGAEAQVVFAEEVVDQRLTRAETRDAIRIAKTRRPAKAAARKPEPFTLTYDDCTITIRWSKPSRETPLAVLSRAVKGLRSEARSGDSP